MWWACQEYTMGEKTGSSTNGVGKTANPQLENCMTASSYTIHKTKTELRMDYRLKGKPWNCETSRRRVGTRSRHWPGCVYLETSPEFQTNKMKAKGGKWYYVKKKSFCTAMKPEKKGENIYKPYGRSDMNFKNMEELLYLNSKQLTTKFSKWAKN